jgi:D-glycero-D-manno-heptose 1,7-bisphosphate phosphatase
LGNQCVILIGGLGTRLGQRTKATPKPLLEVGGAPFLETLFGEARRRGFDEFLLLAGHLNEAVVAFLVERDIERRFSCRVDLSIEPTLLGTGGALINAVNQLRDDFLLLNGDTWFDFNWLDLFARARRDRAGGALALREIDDPDRYETVELDGDIVRAIRPRGRKLASALINGGVYYLTRQALGGSVAPSSLESDILPRLAACRALKGYLYRGFFIDIGVPASLAAADTLVPERRRRSAVFFDHDAVLSLDSGDVHVPRQVDWAAGAKEAVKLLNDAGYYAFVLTHESGVATDLRGEAATEAPHRRVSEELAAVGASVDDWRNDPSHPEADLAPSGAAHPGRKPGPGAILDLFAHWPIAREGSFLIGNKASDIEAAEAAGIRGYAFEGRDLHAYLRERLRQQQTAQAR